MNSLSNSFASRYPVVAVIAPMKKQIEVLMALLKNKGHQVFHIPDDEPIEFRLQDFDPDIVLIQGERGQKAWRERKTGQDRKCISAVELPEMIPMFDIYDLIASGG